ncbi:MAG TPA: hypothetical protein VD866_22235 [Urbifossiella sp.]|nr:hypothetical protein [Urbifossiella sp.]
MGTKTKSRPIRVGDTVRIVTPAFFIRCGYPIAFADVVAKVRADHLPLIELFLKAVGVKFSALNYEPPPASVDKVAKAVAYDLLKLAGHGGRERRIHTKAFPELAGQAFRVTGVRFVKTGDYSPGRHHGGYDGYEYDPPYLANEQTHRILALAGSHEWEDGYGRTLSIELSNVELMTEFAAA